MIITVGSQNNAKLLSVQFALNKLFPNYCTKLVSNANELNNLDLMSTNIIYIQGFNVTSGVSSQPMSDDECILGATNRAINALNKQPNALYGIGIEGGAHKIGNKWFECGWIVVKKNSDEPNEANSVGIASSARLELSNKIIDMIKNEGIELGTVMDKLSGKESVKTNDGAMGLMTNNLVTRSSVYSDGIILAFSKFISNEKYWK